MVQPASREHEDRPQSGRESAGTGSSRQIDRPGELVGIVAGGRERRRLRALLPSQSDRTGGGGESKRREAGAVRRAQVPRRAAIYRTSENGPGGAGLVGANALGPGGQTARDRWLRRRVRPVGRGQEDLSPPVRHAARADHAVHSVLCHLDRALHGGTDQHAYHGAIEGCRADPQRQPGLSRTRRRHR